MRSPQELADFDLLCAATNAMHDSAAIRGFDSLSEVDRHVLAVWSLDSDVNNGGFDQYFFNSWSDWWPAALDGLSAIGAHETVEIVRSALAAFPQQPSTDRDARGEQLEMLGEDGRRILESATDEFFERPDDLETLLARYLRANAT